MVMEAHDHDHHHHQELNSQIMNMSKGKRTKRQRLALTMAPARPSTSSTTSGGGAIDSDHEYHRGNIVSIVSSDDYQNEEEDMANCLILLAQGNTNTNTNSYSNKVVTHKISLREMGIQNNCEITRLQSSSSSISSSFISKGLNGNYQCKTCDRCFPSFQALGGHRASHKKFKNNNNNNKNEEMKQTCRLLVTQEKEEKHRKILAIDDNITFTTLSLRIYDNNNNNNNNNNVASKAAIKACKVHECSICGAEFGSGQALGGHMRKHRMLSKNSSAIMGINVGPTMLSIGASTTTTTTTATSTISHLESCLESEKVGRKDVLKLDLNLPAEDDQDHRESKFSFASNEQILVFSTSSLVDCHY